MTEPAAFSADFWQRPPCDRARVSVVPSFHPYKACRLARGHEGDCDLRPTKEEWDRWVLDEETMTP